MTLKQLWDIANGCETLADVARAEKIFRNEPGLSNDEFDELMMTVNYISRELYRA